jgi:hypothetical protein
MNRITFNLVHTVKCFYYHSFKWGQIEKKNQFFFGLFIQQDWWYARNFSNFKILRDNRLIFLDDLLLLKRMSSRDLILTTGGGVAELTFMLVTRLECEAIINL